jgi:hypothetical protein
MVLGSRGDRVRSGQREPTRRTGLGYLAVIPSVRKVNPERLAYDDPSSSDRMSSDARAAAAVVRALRRPAPSLRYEDQPREVAKPSIEISAAAARLAAALHLHLD